MTVPLPLEIELDAIRDSILLPMMLTICENNRNELELSQSSLKKLYVMSTDALMDRIHADLVKVRKLLREANIKVWETEPSRSAIRYRYKCRGYEDDFMIMREVVRAEIGVRLKRYIVDLLQK